MAVKILRTFHPVGQGAFYSEEFLCEEKSVFRVVYDCGCINRKATRPQSLKTVENSIERWGESKHINYLFISHFDYDHVSLLHLFVEKGVKVDKVILPLLHDNEKQRLVNFYRELLNGKEGDGFRKLVEVPVEFWGEIADQIVNIEPVNEDISISDRSFDQIQSSNGRTIKVPSGTVFKYEDWCYVPCNFRNADRFVRLREALAKCFGYEFNPETLSGFGALMKLWDRKKALSKLRHVYCLLEGCVNENSMSVYSGPILGNENWLNVDGLCCTCGDACCSEERAINCVLRGGLEFCGNKSCRPACVYTGDIDLNKVDIKEWYGTYWDFIGTIQVPHHGARLSFHEKPFKDGRYVCPISCSDQAYYKHPNAYVTNALTILGNYPVKITETQSFSQEIMRQ